MPDMTSLPNLLRHEYFDCLLKLRLFQLAHLVILLELIYLNMDVAVSEPCEVIRETITCVRFK